MANKPAGKSSSTATASNARIERRPFVAALMQLRKGTLVVPGLGSPTWDIFASGDSPEYLYSWGGMGLALSTALGVALAQPKKRVLCLTGDGEMMMGIGSLGRRRGASAEKPRHPRARQRALRRDGPAAGPDGQEDRLCAIARGFGIAETALITQASQVKDLAHLLFETPGPTFAVAKIAITEDPWALPVKDGATIARRFQDAIGVK